MFVSIPYLLMKFDKDQLMMERSKVASVKWVRYRKYYKMVKDVNIRFYHRTSMFPRKVI